MEWDIWRKFDGCLIVLQIVSRPVKIDKNDGKLFFDTVAFCRTYFEMKMRYCCLHFFVENIQGVEKLLKI